MDIDKRTEQIRNVTLIGSLINAVLTIGKIIAGIAEGLQALSL